MGALNFLNCPSNHHLLTLRPSHERRNWICKEEDTSSKNTRGQGCQSSKIFFCGLWDQIHRALLDKKNYSVRSFKSLFLLK